MSTTLPNGVVIYDAADNLTPVHTTLAVLAGSLSDAIGGSGSGVRQPQIFTVADATARGNLSTTIAPLTLIEGDIADQRDTDVLYRWSGSAWVVMVEDTGWATPTLGSGWTNVSGSEVKYRRINGVVYLQGRATTNATTANAFTLPTGFRPSQQVIVMLEAAAATTRSTIQTTGVVGQIAAASATNVSFGNFPPFPVA